MIAGVLLILALLAGMEQASLPSCERGPLIDSQKQWCQRAERERLH